MNHLNFRTPPIYRSIVALTLLISVLAMCFPEGMKTYGVDVVVLLIILIGVPHGVADCLIFKYSASSECINQKAKFYLSYILLIILGSLCLLLVPNAAISTFIAVSAYHLGQAHLGYLSLRKNKSFKVVVYSCWGAFVIFAPIILNPEEVTRICSQFLEITWIIALVNQKYLLVSIIILNLIILGVLKQKYYLSKQDYVKEVCNLLILLFLFCTAPLMISFGVYFTLWHSLSSTLDQIKFVRDRHSTFDLTDFYVQVIPLTGSLVILFVAAQFFLSESSFYKPDTPLLTSLFFGSLATITLPHALLRDRLYQN